MSCDKEGSTHHLACDCREAEFVRLRAENERLEEALKTSRELSELRLRDLNTAQAQLCVAEEAVRRIVAIPETTQSVSSTLVTMYHVAQIALAKIKGMRK